MNAQNIMSDKIRGHTMQLSIHYYVLSISEQKSRLYEGFRDKLIDIQDTNFPFENATNDERSVSKDAQERDFFRRTDERFAHYYKQDPLRWVVVGEKRNLNIYKDVTTHQDVLIGMVEGDYTATSPHDLGMIVWPLVKETIAGTNDNAMRDLAKAAKVKRVVSGIKSVGLSLNRESGATLYVEEDYHVKGSIQKTDHSLIFSKHVDLLEVIDDVVDVIIEKVLKMGGTVVFLNSGSLTKHERIALVLHG
jgi:hypothetical protein